MRGLLLRHAVLPSRQLVESGLAAPAPLAFNLSSSSSGSGSSLAFNLSGSSSGSSSSSTNTSLLLDSCTVSTSCDNLAQFAAWLSGQQLRPSVQAKMQVGGYERVHVPPKASEPHSTPGSRTTACGELCRLHGRL